MNNPLIPYAIGIDLGGTKTEAVLLAPDGGELLRVRRPTPLSAGYDAVITGVGALIREASAAVPQGASWTIGVGIPGSIDAVTGIVRNANSTCLIGHPLQHDLEERLLRPVQVRNDADCFAMAECRAGAGRGYDLVFGIIMGTGCGGGLCINGIVREGPHRIAGEWGHICMDPNGMECYCGKRGCIETMISGSGVERRFERETGRCLTMDAIVTGARDGKADCCQAFGRFLDDFGRCVGGIVSLLDPDAIVLGGGLSNIAELYTAGRERVRHYAFHDGITTPLLKNELGDSAGVFGAAWIGRGAC